MEKIRLLYILPEIDGGGVGSVAYNYVKNLPLNEYCIDFIVFKAESNQLWHKELVDIGVNIYYVTPRTESLTKHFKEINEFMKMRKYDIVHAHMSEWSAIYCYIAWKNSVKVRIGHSHVAGSLYSKRKQIILKIMNLIFDRFCNQYFACGKEAAKYLWRKKIIKENKVYIMNNAVSVGKFGYNKKVSVKLKEKYNINNNLVFGHVGRFNEQKNHKFLINLFNEINKIYENSVLILIGDGELKNDIQKQITSLQLQEKVIVLGKRNDIYDWLNVFDLLMLPSLYEGLPVIGIEAQMNGLPILSSLGVTEEVMILKESFRISLNENMDVWRDKSIELALQKKDRINAQKIMKKCGYEISQEAHKLSEFYKHTLENI